MMSHVFFPYCLRSNISVAAANDRCDNPRDRNLARFEESETFLQFIGFTIQLIVG